MTTARNICAAALAAAMAATSPPAHDREGRFCKDVCTYEVDVDPAPGAARTVFTLDMTETPPVASFAQAGALAEVLVLELRPAPGADVVLVLDTGETFLRMNFAGGMTLFSDKAIGHEERGAPVNLIGPGNLLTSLRQTPRDIGAIRAEASDAAKRISAALGVPIDIEGPWESARDDGGRRLLLQKNVTSLRYALARIAATPSDAKLLRDAIRTIRLKAVPLFDAPAGGRKPQIRKTGNAIEIDYYLGDAYSHPSSYRIVSEVRRLLQKPAL